MFLYRPVGLRELELIAQSGFRAFPPRLPEQPIFYPVVNFAYAEQIARDWNTKASPYAGFVTKFEVEEQYVSTFEVQVVGNKTHQELWVPAEKLEEFNQHMIGKIEIVASYYGPEFQDALESQTRLPMSIVKYLA